MKHNTQTTTKLEERKWDMKLINSKQSKVKIKENKKVWKWGRDNKYEKAGKYKGKKIAMKEDMQLEKEVKKKLWI